MSGLPFRSLLLDYTLRAALSDKEWIHLGPNNLRRLLKKKSLTSPISKQISPRPGPALAANPDVPLLNIFLEGLKGQTFSRLIAENYAERIHAGKA